MAEVELELEPIFEKVKRSLISNNFKEERRYYEESVFSNGNFRILVKLVSSSHLSSFYESPSKILLDTVLDIISTAMNENYDRVITICPRIIKESIEPKLSDFPSLSNKLFIISIEEPYGVQDTLDFLFSSLKKEPVAKAKRDEKRTKIREIEAKPVEIPIKVTNLEEQKEIKEVLEALTSRIKNLEDKYSYIINQIEKLRNESVVRQEKEKIELKRKQKVTVEVSKKEVASLGSLPSFFKDNPWIEILSSRDRET